MLNTLDKNVQALAAELSKTNDNERLTAYAGVGYSFVNKNRDKILAVGSEMKIKMEINELFYIVNEVAILDKDLFIATINKFVDFIRTPMKSETLITTFSDAIGIKHSFGSKFQNIIDENIATFRTCKMCSDKVIEEIKD